MASLGQPIDLPVPPPSPDAGVTFVRVIALIDRMLPRDVDASDPDVLRRARLAVVLNLAVVATTSILLGLSAGGGGDPARLIPLVAIDSMAVVGLLGRWLHLRASHTTHLIPALVFVPAAAVSLASLGEGTGALVATMIVPMVAVAVTGIRGCVRWSCACLVLLGAIAALEVAGAHSIYPVQMLTWNETRIALVAVLVCFVTGMCLFFEWVRERSLDEVREARDATAESEARYRALAENAGDVVLEVDPDLTFTYAAPNVARLFGRAPDDVLGRSLAPWIHPGDAAVVEVFRAAAVSTRDAPFRAAFRVQAEGRRPIHLECSLKAHKAAPEQTRIVVIARDVTALHHAEQAIRRSERLSSIGTLTAGVAHQINNPIGTILAGSQIARLSLDERDFEAVTLALADIESSARRCGDIVRDLLRFARDEESRREEIDVVDLCRRACDLTRSYARERGTDIHFEPDCPAQIIEANCVELDQVMINLLRNAIEAGPKERGVQVEVEPGETEVRIHVRDDGKGIEAAILDHIFDPFFTTRLDDGGSGLGLSVAYGIVKDHGGRIDATSEPGSGACFRIRLPLAVARP